MGANEDENPGFDHSRTLDKTVQRLTEPEQALVAEVEAAAADQDGPGQG
ncbi:hypothetical protein [Streptomyces sp. NPDC049944]